MNHFRMEEPATLSSAGNNNISVRPVFIIGSYRSGTSILTWALGQHSNIFPLEETNWIYRLGMYMDCLYHMGTVNGQHSNLSSMEVTRNKFYRSFGSFIHSFIQDNRINYVKAGLKLDLRKKGLSIESLDKINRLQDFAAFTNENDSFAVVRNENDSKSRWIDGTPENSHFVYCLNLLFPQAKFIFMLRNPIKVAHSLMNFSTVEGNARSYEEENAYRQWYALTESCYLALKAYGRDKILLIHQEDLVADREKVIGQCLSFIDEEYESNCLKPLAVTINSSKFDKGSINYSIEDGLQSEKEYVRDACRLYNEVIEESSAMSKGSLEYYRLLRNRYKEQAKHFY